MQYRLRTLVTLTAVGPPLLAAAWLWCRPLIADAFLFLLLYCFAFAIVVPALAIVALVWKILKGAVWLMRILLRLTIGDRPLPVIADIRRGQSVSDSQTVSRRPSWPRDWVGG
jgi:hypothetical protein